MGRLKPELKEERLKRILLRRMGLPKEVAYAAVFLASDASGYITGKVVDVNGGQL